MIQMFWCLINRSLKEKERNGSKVINSWRDDCQGLPITKNKKKWVLRLKNVTAAKYGSNKGNQT